MWLCPIHFVLNPYIYLTFLQSANYCRDSTIHCAGMNPWVTKCAVDIMFWNLQKIISSNQVYFFHLMRPLCWITDEDVHCTCPASTRVHWLLLCFVCIAYLFLLYKVMLIKSTVIYCILCSFWNTPRWHRWSTVCWSDTPRLDWYFSKELCLAYVITRVLEILYWIFRVQCTLKPHFRCQVGASTARIASCEYDHSHKVLTSNAVSVFKNIQESWLENPSSDYILLHKSVNMLETWSWALLIKKKKKRKKLATPCRHKNCIHLPV